SADGPAAVATQGQVIARFEAGAPGKAWRVSLGSRQRVLRREGEALRERGPPARVLRAELVLRAAVFLRPAVLRVAVFFLADALRAVVFFRPPAFRAVDFLAVDFRAVDFLAVDFRAVDFFFAVVFRAGDFFFAESFFAF